MRRQLISAAILALLGAVPSSAQTTGRITGQVLDASGSAVPGVAVTATSPQLQGTLSTITDNNGYFRFPTVPPGTYRIRAELPGFKTVEQPDVSVGIDRTVTLAFHMEVAPVTETVTVEAGGPVIDITSSTTGVNATADLFNRLPVARDFYAIARVAPGSQTDDFGAAIYGSTSAENQYIIEGLNTTGIEVGTQGKTLNFDFIEEIEIKTGGLPAEYGRMTGGVINVLTKSGGNQFKTDLFGFYEGGGLQSNDETRSQRPATTTSVFNVAHKYDFGIDLGGYLVKDKLWFFGAYNRVDERQEREVIRVIDSPGSPTPGSVIPATIKSNLYAGKLTWKINADHTLTGSIFGDPAKREGSVFTISGPPSTWEGTRDFGSADYVGRYDGVFSNSFLVRAMYGRHNEKDTFGGAGRDIAGSIDQTVTPNASSGGFGFFQDQEFSRDVVKLDLTKFVGGGHEFKLGGDWEKVDTNSLNYQGGAGQRIYKRRSGSTIYYRHRYYVNDLAPGFSRSDSSTWQIALPQVSAPNSRNFSAYLQDSWKPAKNFTLNLGVRWEQQDVRNRFDESAFKISDNWSPRIGFVWDVQNNGKSKLYANYGRFYENIPQDINIRAFGGEVVCFCNNFDPTPNNIRPAAGTPASSLLGGSEPVDPNLKGQYIDEWLGGFEYEVAPNLAVGVKGTYRNLGRVIEDFLVPSEGEYFIANPAEGIGKTLAFYDGVSTAPAPKAKRKQIAFELTARKRFSNGWQFLASYLWNKLEGNYDGLFQNSSGQLDPNINSAFDYADFTVNAFGRLSTERQHQVKFDGSYQFKGGLDGLNLGLSTWWYSGLPQNAYGYSGAYLNWEYFLVPRGSVGRGPSDYEANLHVSYPIKVGDRSRVIVLMDVFNLLNRQAVQQFDERYNRIADGSCAGVPDDLCNGDGGLLNRPGTTDPLGTIPNPRATAPNPDYLTKGIYFTGQRSIRVGIRLNF
jgi:carboxypeptidase family protein/TonB-dependent receptor-like protein